MQQTVHQQTPKQTAAAQNASVSTLQALEQMVMPPSVPAPVMQNANMDVSDQYYSLNHINT